MEAQVTRPPGRNNQQARPPLNLPEASHFLAAVIESSDDAIITKDLDGIITTWNNGAQRIFGYTAEETVGQPVSMLIPPDRQDEEPHILARLRRGERIDHYETIRRRKDGTLINISLTVSPVHDSSGRIIGASKIARDITEIKKAREDLARSHEELERLVSERTTSLTQAIEQMEEFSYTISHDLRAPVRAIKGYAEAFLEDYGQGLNTVERKYLENILAAGSRMEQLTQELLTYSRVARAQVSPMPVSLQDLVSEIIVNYPEMQPPRADIKIRNRLHSVIAYEPLITQAISNLLANAVKFVSPGTKPQVQVGTDVRGSFVRFWIQDNGIGIPAKYQHRLFSMFERAHNATGYQGTGVGLAIVRKAAEKMGGRVGVESDVTHGSLFWLELPAAPEK